jgi:hypothetical protein
MGGLVAGALLALVVGYKRPGERAGVAVFWHILQFAALALVIFGFVMVARNYNKTYPNLSDVVPPSLIADDPTGFVNAINEGRNALVVALSKGDAGGIDKAVKALETASSPDKRSGELRDELKTLLARAKDYTAMPSSGRTQQRARVQQQRALVTDLKSWDEKFDQWVKAEGNNYGIYVPEQPPQAKDSPQEK